MPADVVLPAVQAVFLTPSPLFDEFLDNPRPLYNSNMAKVSIVKWSQKWIFVDGNPFFGPTPYFEIALKPAVFKIFGMPEMAIP